MFTVFFSRPRIGRLETILTNVYLRRLAGNFSRCLLELTIRPWPISLRLLKRGWRRKSNPIRPIDRGNDSTYSTTPSLSPIIFSFSTKPFVKMGWEKNGFSFLPDRPSLMASAYNYSAVGQPLSLATFCRDDSTASAAASAKAHHKKEASLSHPTHATKTRPPPCGKKR